LPSTIRMSNRNNYEWANRQRLHIGKRSRCSHRLGVKPFLWSHISQICAWEVGGAWAQLHSCGRPSWASSRRRSQGRHPRCWSSCCSPVPEPNWSGPVKARSKSWLRLFAALLLALALPGSPFSCPPHSGISGWRALHGLSCPQHSPSGLLAKILWNTPVSILFVGCCTYLAMGCLAIKEIMMLLKNLQTHASLNRKPLIKAIKGY